MEHMIIHRDFSSISHSAKWLLFMKGHTTIPFAREAAELLEYPNKYIPDLKREILLSGEQQCTSKTGTGVLISC